MSSDVDDEQVLPDSLQKLEIVPDYSQTQPLYKIAKSNDEQSNPFSMNLFANDIDDRVSIYRLCQIPKIC